MCKLADMFRLANIFHNSTQSTIPCDTDRCACPDMQEDPGVFAGVMTQVGQGLTVASRQLLTPQASPQLAPGGGNEEIGERLCATLAVFAQHAPIMTQGQPDLLEQVCADKKKKTDQNMIICYGCYGACVKR